jgi:hypothetical protein
LRGLLQLEREEREHWRGRGGIQERDDDDDDDGSSIHGLKEKKESILVFT